MGKVNVRLRVIFVGIIDENLLTTCVIDVRVVIKSWLFGFSSWESKGFSNDKNIVKLARATSTKIQNIIERIGKKNGEIKHKPILVPLIQNQNVDISKMKKRFCQRRGIIDQLKGRFQSDICDKKNLKMASMKGFIKIQIKF